MMVQIKKLSDIDVIDLHLSLDREAVEDLRGGIAKLLASFDAAKTKLEYGEGAIMMTERQAAALKELYSGLVVHL